MPEQMTFEGLLEAMPDALIGVDPSGAIRFVNHQAELLFGYDHDELVGQPLETLVPESLRTAHAAQRESYFSDPLTRALGSGLDLSGRRQDGTEIPVDISLSHLDTVDGPLVIASVRDMTERKKAEAGRLRAERMSAVVEFSGEAILSSTLDGIITSYNRAAEKVFGYTEDEIVGTSGSLLSPKDRAYEASTILATIMTGQPVMNFETIRVRKDGTAFPVSLTVSPIFDYGGTVVGASAIPRDITSQKHAFDAAQHMAAIIENSDDAIIGKTLDGIITNWNPAAERMFGYSSSEILGKPAGLLSPEDRPHEMTAILAKIRAGQAVERLETTRLRKDGTAFTVSLTVSPIHDPNGAIVGASTITRDVTKQRQAFEAARSMIESSL
ncbi:MAG TPA: PAS domain-containing protein, partial [Dermatophilaceae bacterium]